MRSPRAHHRLDSRRWGTALALVLLAAGCKGANLPSAPSTFSSEGAVVFNVTIDSSATSVAIGGKLALSLAGTDDQGNPTGPLGADAGATWKSQNPTLASVNAQGVVTGLKRGTATIQVTTTNPARQSTLAVRVLGPGETPPPGTTTASGNSLAADGRSLPLATGTGDGASPAGLAIEPPNPRVMVGARLSLVASQLAGNSSRVAGATWRSLDPAIATIDTSGQVTGIKAGTVTIEASSQTDGTMIGRASLLVANPVASAQVRGITITPSRVTMSIGETFWLDARVPTFAGGFDPNVSWESGDTTIVTVSDTGQLTAVGSGSTTVTAIATTYNQGELSAVVPVSVRNEVVSQ